MGRRGAAPSTCGFRRPGFANRLPPLPTCRQRSSRRSTSGLPREHKPCGPEDAAADLAFHFCRLAMLDTLPCARSLFDQHRALL